MAKRYVLDENNNKIEVTNEVGNTTVNEVRCCVTGAPVKMAFVTQAKYNELKAAGLLQANTHYEITDDTTAQDIDTQLKELNAQVGGLESGLNEVNTKLNNKHLYCHRIYFSYTKDANKYVVYLDIYNTSATPINTFSLLMQQLPIGGITATGYVTQVGTSLYTPIYGINKNLWNNSQVRIYAIFDYDNQFGADVYATEFESITDTVQTIY